MERNDFKITPPLSTENIFEDLGFADTELKLNSISQNQFNRSAQAFILCSSSKSSGNWST